MSRAKVCERCTGTDPAGAVTLAVPMLSKELVGVAVSVEGLLALIGLRRGALAI